MSKISKGIRAKRFEVNDTMGLKLLLETEMGERVEMKVKNGSLSGLGAVLDKEEAERLAFEPGKLVPESKLIWTENEVPLGRLAMRSKVPNGTTVVFGFSCIDSKVPLMGSLSKCFSSLSSGKETALDYELNAGKYNLASFLEAEHSHADIFNKCYEYELLNQDLKKNPFFQYYAIRHDVNGNRVKLSTPQIRKPTDYVTFGTYDYFGFSNDPEIKEAAIKAIEKFGVSATATPPLSGNTSLHEELEEKIARLLRKESAMLFGSGFAANVGSLTAILRPNDMAVADILSHASIHDGLQASSAKIRYFRHNSAKHCNSLLEEHRDDHAGTLVITEGLFSMDGDVPDLRGIVKAARAHNARIFIDEVHSMGVMGPTGLGAAEREGVLDDIDVYTSCFNKGFGAGGGFVAGSKAMINWLRGFARACIFSSAIPPGLVAAAMKSLDLNQKQPERRQKLQANIKQFRDGLVALGYEPKSDPESPIIPVIIGDEKKLGEMNKVFLEFGIFVNPVVFPAVAVNASRFRFSLSAAHSYADIQLALMALKRALEVAGVDFGARPEKAVA